MERYNKPPLTYTEQMELLKSRGMTIPDEKRAERLLANISYYRLSAYMLPYKKSEDGMILDAFKTGTTWDMIYNLYVFDRKLRLLVFDAIERLEVSIRTQIIYQLSHKYGSHWQDRPDIFNPPTEITLRDGRKVTLDVYNDIQKHIKEQLHNNKAEVFIQHYRNKYDTPENPPSWMSVEIMYFIEGIYQAMANADEDGNASVVVSWENNIKQDPEGFEKSIKDEISKISQAQGWADINEDRYGKLDLKKIEDFEQLIAKIAKCSGDTAWLRHHADRDVYRKLRMAFCKKRDKDDTDKAIYRLCCIGLVDDVTIDYLSQTYELKIHKCTDEEFKQYMLDFFRKYYSTEQAQKKVNEIDKQEGRNYLDKCLGYLTAFVYDNLEKKRYRAIEDMRIACEDSIIERQANGDDEWLKEFIHLYFNSKYARTGYQVNGKPYSLKDDTDIDGRDGFDVVQKYIEIINPANDNSGSEIDNIKHLYGATLLCLRAHPDNAALQLLLTYCITVLGAGNNETLKSNAYNNYIEGFMSLSQNTGSEVWDYIDQFNSHLASKVRDDDDYIRDKLIENGKKMITLFIHEKKINEIVNKYLNI